MAALALTSTAAFAQDANKENCPKKEHCQKADCKKDGKKECKSLKLFSGIELSADQQKQLDQLCSQRQENKKADKKARLEAKKQERQDFDDAVAKILTPEQYTLYKANCAKVKEKHDGMKDKRDKTRKNGKGEKKGKGNKDAASKK